MFIGLQLGSGAVALLAWFVPTLIVLAGGAMAWLVCAFRIDKAKQPAE
jgi:hypothetical protein